MRGSDAARWTRAFSRTDLASASSIQRSWTFLRIATSTFVFAAKPAWRVTRIRTAKRKLPSSLSDPGDRVALIEDDGGQRRLVH
jgi:hypothetical protein